MIIVSACLAGLNTRYDGADCLDSRVAALVSSGEAIAVCPEQLGGLATPRSPVELRRNYNQGTKTGDIYVIGSDGKDYTSALIKGALETLKLAAKLNIRKAIFKDGSPSCGVNYIWCSGHKISGRGITTELLQKNNIEIITIDSI
ncbi:MAG: DUF523 domain-containing protein [Nitrospirota bacterium]|nr:DUF523 domain-containing protein [Nitrospirota bacterium]